MLPKKGYMDIRPASGGTECALNRRGGVSISTFRSGCRNMESGFTT